MKKKADPRDKTFFLAKKAYTAWLDGQSWVPHTAELLKSPAWRYLSLYGRRLIDRLEIEHAIHNGLENGFLTLTYRQMKEAGIHSDAIPATLDEVQTVGLLTITHRGAYRAGGKRDPNSYRLNHLPWKFAPATGAPVYYAPTDEWKKYTGKAARRKSIPEYHPGGASEYHPGGASEPGRRDTNASDPAKMADQPSAPPGWYSSSIRRSIKRRTASAGVPPPPVPPPVASAPSASAQSGLANPARATLTGEGNKSGAGSAGLFGAGLPEMPTPEEVIRRAVKEVCEREHGLQSRLATALGISRGAMANKLSGRERFTTKSRTSLSLWLSREPMPNFPDCPMTEDHDDAVA